MARVRLWGSVAVLALLTLAIAVSEEERFATRSTPLVADDGSELGTIYLGTRVALAEASVDAAHVMVEGWSMTASPSVLFFAPAQRIPLASLTEAGQAARSVLEETTDAYGTAWQRVRVAGLAEAAALGDDAGELWSEAAEFYTASCSACHALHDPREFTANQWPGSLKPMLPNVAFTEDQVDLVTRYLQYHAKDM